MRLSGHGTWKHVQWFEDRPVSHVPGSRESAPWNFHAESQKVGEMMEALKKKDHYTVEDIYNLPEGERAELLDGQIYNMAPPGTVHQRISMKLSGKISSFIGENEGKCEVFAAPFAVFLGKDDRNYVEPDISIICDPEKITEKGCNGAPDWIIEIVSPGSRTMDYYKKLFKYRTAHQKARI